MVTSLRVNLGTRAYPIHFGANLSPQITSAVQDLRAAGRKAVIVADQTVAEAQASFLAPLLADAPVIRLPAGEGTKSVVHLATIWDFLAAQRIDRTGVVIAFGGGVVGDLAGFAAASYLRGVEFWQVPTTLLAMVDSSVGGKTGINLVAGKNLVGAFHQPRSVFISTDLLETLSRREFAAGMAEVLKYGLLADAGLWSDLVASALRPGDPRLGAVVRRCCEIKAQVVEADEFETAKDGGRALLNLGHTFGHAIEQVSGYGTYLHGEAVAIGLVAAARLSTHLGRISGNAVAEVEQAIIAHELPARLRTPLPIDALMGAMARDKKVRAGQLRFVVLERIGKAVTVGDVDSDLARLCFAEVGAH